MTSGLSWIDLEFLGRPHAIATGVVQGAAGLALIDPGPSSCLATLERGLARQGAALADVTDILLTHVHLDHAGATGTVLRRVPHITVHVHERGAPHVSDPARLIQSASRLYGDDMERLWGEVAPVPSDRLHVLRGGERLEVAGRSLAVAYTPGHASHHVSYFDSDSGVAFVGDTGGMLIDGGRVIPPTPPPDIDLALWRQSADLIAAWSPATLFRTHYGPSNHPVAELTEMLDTLDMMARLVRETLDEPGTDDTRSTAFAQRLGQTLRRSMSDGALDTYRLSAPFHLLWLGLARYWRKRS